MTMTELFSQLNSLAVYDGIVRVSNEHGTVSARFTSGRLTALTYKSNRKQ